MVTDDKQLGLHPVTVQIVQNKYAIVMIHSSTAPAAISLCVCQALTDLNCHLLQT